MTAISPVYVCQMDRPFPASIFHPDFETPLCNFVIKLWGEIWSWEETWIITLATVLTLCFMQNGGNLVNISSAKLHLKMGLKCVREYLILAFIFEPNLQKKNIIATGKKLWNVKLFLSGIDVTKGIYVKREHRKELRRMSLTVFWVF